MSVQNPTLPTAVEAQGIDAVVLDMQLLLDTNLIWLTNGMGRAYILNKVRSNGATQFLPLVYLGTSSHDYFPATPDNDKTGQNFFLVSEATYPDQSRGHYGIKEYDVSIVFSVNLKTIDATLLLTEDFTEHLIEEVDQVILRESLGKPYTIAINSSTRRFSEVYSEFDLDPSTRIPLAEMGYFRFNLTVQIREACPVTSLNRCGAILQNISHDDICSCIFPTFNFAPGDDTYFDCLSAQQKTDLTTRLCVPSFVNSFSMKFDGVNESIQQNNNAAYDFTNTDPWTFTVRLQIDDNGFHGLLRHTLFSGSFRGYLIDIRANKVYIILRNTATTNEIIIDTSAAVFVIGTVYHLAVTYDGSSTAAGFKVYINGISVAMAVPIRDNLTATTTAATILGFGIGGNFINGTLNVARLWNVAFTPAQVLLDYNSNVPEFPILPINQVAGCDMGDGASYGTTVWTFEDTTATTSGYQSVNMEAGDKVAAI